MPAGDNAALKNILRNTNHSNNNNSKGPQKREHQKQSNHHHHHIIDRNGAPLRHAFEADYGDHFETPLVAYSHISPMLKSIAVDLKLETTNDLTVYDPFYCAGSVKQKLASIGFGSVINENRDFYKDVATRKVPNYDVIVTNPPYSANEKERFLQWLVSENNNSRSWFVLLPNYVANKQYWKSDVVDALVSRGKPPPFYIVPQQRYEYDHPEGTGHSECPFLSIWFCFVPTFELYEKCGEVWFSSNNNNNNSSVVKMFSSVDELQNSNAVPTEKRLSSKRRAKLRKLRSGV
eukprot:PhM_4_TR15159/c0_g1_i1/m.70578